MPPVLPSQHLLLVFVSLFFGHVREVGLGIEICRQGTGGTTALCFGSLILAATLFRGLGLQETLSFALLGELRKAFLFRGLGLGFSLLDVFGGLFSCLLHPLFGRFLGPLGCFLGCKRFGQTWSLESQFSFHLFL